MKSEILTKLEMLADYLKLLREYQKRGFEEVKEDPTLRGGS